MKQVTVKGDTISLDECISIEVTQGIIRVQTLHKYHVFKYNDPELMLEDAIRIFEALRQAEVK